MSTSLAARFVRMLVAGEYVTPNPTRATFLPGFCPTSAALHAIAFCHLPVVAQWHI